ncbi:hypothetical protein AD006_31770 (plasmid) [Pseudonocardia sp. EC080610-09]|uniref:TetR/AcrR family transcriptional regulator n=1 Tax=unclassified Pseudonocardia TaxID=2619320 RepID=UPI000706AEAF|nr:MULTISPECIES: TetR/AcrR family transcriptional regulator [unclassified Pseudonocardia]ALL79720.1 hypothetical protein AD006_31770 [Pseudonocardia sp. EC080610-09]ALL85151.1 hypothetical protein AD017_28295 [Pseudonocardia sp. EC080619-01]
MRAAERRIQLARAAAARFHLVGYHQVSLNDVAADVGLTGPAVYRHFPNKQALLAAAVDSGLDEVERALDHHIDDALPVLMDALAHSAVQRPDVWTLLQREIRVLDPNLREPIRHRIRLISDRLTDRLCRDRPRLREQQARLLVIGAFAVLAMPSTSHTSLGTVPLRRALAAAATECLLADVDAADINAATGAPGDGDAVSPREGENRRERIVDTAVELFFERGFSGVSLDDIGAAIGIAGPSILHHFATKADILTAAFDRATARLEAEQHARRDGSRSVELTALVRRYVDFCGENRALLGLYVTDFLHLTDEARERTAATMRTELRDWTRSVLAHALDLDDRIARIRVRAALSVVNDMTRLGPSGRGSTDRDVTTAAALAVLRSP